MHACHLSLNPVLHMEATNHQLVTFLQIILHYIIIIYIWCGAMFRGSDESDDVQFLPSFSSVLVSTVSWAFHSEAYFNYSGPLIQDQYNQYETMLV